MAKLDIVASCARVVIVALAIGLGIPAASAQCAGDCDADGQSTVDELVTMINAALGEVPAFACGAGDANLDDAITVDEIIAGIDAALDGCALRRTYDFRGGRQGWEPDFSDYSPEMGPVLELDSGPRTLPAELGSEGLGYLITGLNHPDDLWMSISRRLTTTDGIEPGRTYSVDYSIVFASNAPSGCAGIGGAPGESVFLKAGASAVEPVPSLDEEQGLIQMNVDKGEQGQGGADASLVGDVANGLPCKGGDQPYVSLRREHRHELVTASDSGDLWLIVGTDSGYEGTTTLYYQRIEVRLTPIAELQLNDVSILFPLPAPETTGELLAPVSAGERGALLPAELYASVPKLHVFQTPEETYQRLRVVALRLDPCFRTTAECRRQLRLTMQPVVFDELEQAMRGDDAAIHLFYDLSAADFAALLDELRRATIASTVPTNGPLRVHPILQQEGLTGRFAQRLRGAVLRYASGDNLSRLTFMQLQNFNVNEWMFGGFDVVDGTLVPIDIIDAGSQRQRFINVFLESEEDFVASVDPKPLGDDDISLLFNSNNARAASNEAIAAAETAALRIENPNVHTTETVSCVACHVATQARLWTERSLGRSSEGHPDRFTAAADLSLNSETKLIPGSLRAFGYLHRKVAISQRTVNETAAVAAALNGVDR